MSDEESLKEQLRREDMTFRRLSMEHTLLDQAIHKMLRRKILTPKEDMHRKRLQVEKLHAKDKMQAILRERRKIQSV